MIEKQKGRKKSSYKSLEITNIVISDKIIHKKYVIILCKNKWNNSIERIYMNLELLQKAIEEEYDLLKFKACY